MQRVAIARALVGNPAVLIADEPTGNLDTRRAGEIRDLLADLNRSRGVAILLVTHSPEMAQIGTRRIVMRDGRIEN